MKSNEGNETTTTDTITTTTTKVTDDQSTNTVEIKSTTNTKAPLSVISSKFSIPRDKDNAGENGKLSFIFPIYNLKETDMKIDFLNENNITITTLDFKRCCAKIKNTVTGYFDTFEYPSNWESITSMNLTIAWTKVMIYLIISSTLVPLAGIVSYENPSPYSVIFSDKNKNEVSTTWNFNSNFDNILSNTCTITSPGNKCKSGSVKLVLDEPFAPEKQYLRYAFAAPPEHLYPITITLYSSSSFLASIKFSNTMVEIKSDSKSNTVTIPSPTESGQWIAGDIFLLTSSGYNFLKDNSNNYQCLFITTASCFATQSTQNWRQYDKNLDLLRYAYIKGTEYRTKSNEYINKQSPEVDNSESDAGNEILYLYVSYNNVIIGGIPIPSSSDITELRITGSKDLVPIAYWRLSQGMTPSINVSTNTLKGLISQIKSA